MSGAAITLNEPTEPANIIASNPTSAAIRAEMPPYTEAGWIHRPPLMIARSRSRRSVQFMAPALPRVAKSQRVLARPDHVPTGKHTDAAARRSPPQAAFRPRTPGL